MNDTSAPETPKLNRVERRKIQTRANLIDAMYKLTSKLGVEAVTIRNIVDEADIAKGSFYNFFETKEELLEAVLVKVVGESAELIDSTIFEFEDPIETIATAFLTLDRIVSSDNVLGWFIVNVSPEKPILGAQLRKSLLRDVNRGIEDGYFNVPNVDLAVDLFSLSVLAFQRGRLQGIAPAEDIPIFIQYMMRVFGADEEHAKSVIESVCERFQIT